jgi:hypothetical protein
MISGRRRLPETRVEKPGCLTTPAPPFPVRSEPRARARGPSGSGLTRGLGSPREISNGYAGSCLQIRLTAPAPGLLLRLTTVPDHALAQVSHIRWFSARTTGTPGTNQAERSGSDLTTRQRPPYHRSSGAYSLDLSSGLPAPQGRERVKGRRQPVPHLHRVAPGR